MEVLVLSVVDRPHSRMAAAVSRAGLLGEDLARLRPQELRETTFRRPKPEYAVAGDIHAYEVCPQQYLHYNEYGFVPSRGAGQMFGTLVHRTIEDAHRFYLRNRDVPEAEDLQRLFDRNLRALTRGEVHPLAEVFREMAWNQVTRYVDGNADRFRYLVKAEEPVSVDAGEYIINGNVDLIRGDTGELELIDFKTQGRPDDPDSEPFLEFYRFQLALYSHLIGVKLGETPKRTFIDWTAEEDPDRALQRIPSDEVSRDEALKFFNERVQGIQNEDFRIKREPPRDVCRNCDLSGTAVRWGTGFWAGRKLRDGWTEGTGTTVSSPSSMTESW